PAPEGPRPPLRFPMPGADPASVAKPPVATPWSGDFADEAELDVELEPPPLDEPWEPSGDWGTESTFDEELEEPPAEGAAFDDEGEVEGDAESAPGDSPTLVTPGRGVELPHWTEPGTGDVPAILGDSEPAGDEEELAWSSVGTGPRWRDQPSDWEESDFGDA